MKRFINPEKSTWKSLIKRASASYDSIEPLAKVIFNEVEKNGDLAIKEYTVRFDKVKLESNMVSSEEISNAAKKIPENLKIAIQKAKNNIELFHKAQITSTIHVETQPGLIAGKKNYLLKKLGYIYLADQPYFLRY